MLDGGPGFEGEDAVNGSVVAAERCGVVVVGPVVRAVVGCERALGEAARCGDGGARRKTSAAIEYTPAQSAKAPQ